MESLQHTVTDVESELFFVYFYGVQLHSEKIGNLLCYRGLGNIKPVYYYYYYIDNNGTMMKIQNNIDEREKYAGYEYETGYPKHLPDNEACHANLQSMLTYNSTQASSFTLLATDLAEELKIINQTRNSKSKALDKIETLPRSTSNSKSRKRKTASGAVTDRAAPAPTVPVTINAPSPTVTITTPANPLDQVQEKELDKIL
jgi:hypothetical protein